MSTLTLEPPAGTESDPGEPAEITLAQLAVHLQQEFAHDKLIQIVTGIAGDELWRITERYHSTLHDLKGAISKLNTLDAREVAGKDPAAWQRPLRVVRVAPELQERLRRNLAVRKMAIGDPAAQSLVVSVTTCFLDQSLEVAKQAEVERRTPKPSPPPAPRADMVGMAEQVLAAAAAAEAVEQRAVKVELERRYCEVIAKFRNPGEGDVRELAELIPALSINPEQVRRDIDLIKNAVRLRSAYDRQLQWLRMLCKARGLDSSDAELLNADDRDAAAARTAARELGKLAKQRSLLFNTKVSPPCLRYLPAPDEVSG